MSNMTETPQAIASIDGNFYHVTCPICKHRMVGAGSVREALTDIDAEIAQVKADMQ